MRLHRLAGFGSIALGLGIAGGAILGPLALRVIKFRTSPNIEHQFSGGEIASLALVAPALIGAGVLWRRDHRLAPAIAIGPALYAVYTYATVIGGQEYARYPGNVERFFPLYAVVVSGGAALAAFAWSRLDPAELPVPSDRLRRALAGEFLVLGGFFALAWTAQIKQVLSGNPSREYLEGPTLFWLIKLLDFGFCIPALLASGVGLLRRSPGAIKPAVGLAGFSTCLTASIAGMATVMIAKNDPSASPVMLAVALPAALALAITTRHLLCSAMPVSPLISDPRSGLRYRFPAGRSGKSRTKSYE